MSNSGWLGHCLSLYVPYTRQQELLTFVEERTGPRHKNWRLVSGGQESLIRNGNYILKFARKEQAMLIKLTWEEDKDPIPSLSQYYLQIIKSLGNINFSHHRSVAKAFSQKVQLNSLYGTIGNQGVRNAPLYSNISDAENGWLLKLFPDSFPTIKGSRKTKNLSLIKSRGGKIMSTEELEEYLNEVQK